MEMTVQEVYDAGENLAALLGDHESVYVLYTYNGKVFQEDYLTKEYSYSFYDGEYFEFGADIATLATDHAEYYYSENTCALSVTLTPNGMADMKERFAIAGTGSFISSTMLDDTPVVTEKDGFIIATCTSDQKELEEMGIEGVVSCEETYTLDAKTREMTSVKTVYTYEDGSVDEGIVTITRDAEIPEGMKAFLEYEQETENMCTVTIVSNPGTENEKIESIQVPKGLLVGFAPDFDVDKTFTVYTDAACTQAIEEEMDVNSDIAAYIKWDE